MKLKSISLGLLSVVLLSFSVYFFSKKELATESVYVPRSEISETENSIHGARELWQKLLQNPQTGEIDINAMYTAREQVRQRGSSRASSLDWSDMGPDNVGGRTRAILFDNTDATGQIVYAGGVTGGLFKSTNAAGLWDPVPGFSNLPIS
ncbi:MAG: hypothetical protein MRY83_20755, partial [Flavobacteriales bacterium]|nr:hypothetical protein [Flavobacteriales bacterium]